MPSMQRSHFIEDIVYLVLDSSNHWWPRDLFQLAQVSSAWLGPVRRRLFACPSLHSFQACTMLAHTLSDNPTLSCLVKGIELRPMSVDSTYVSSEDRASLNMLLGIEGLQLITLGGILSVRAERFLHRIGDAYSVLYLHIDGSSMAHSISLSHCPSLEWDESLAFQFCNLKTLHLSNMDLAISPPSIPYQLQIFDLQFDHVTFTRGYIPQLLHETASLPRLRLKSAEASELDEQIKCVLDAYVVRTLEVEVDTEGPLNLPAFDSPLPSIRCLRLNGFNLDLEAMMSIDKSCCNLERLQLSGITVTILTSFLTSGHFPKLTFLDLSWDTKSRKQARCVGDKSTIEDLLKATRYRGINLNLGYPFS
ncbi:hypothetical protein H0H93_008107 [Arthromyces matolae]|nr:hypothetical protein H0H93_008107 [Arthromyces matolae]